MKSFRGFITRVGEDDYIFEDYDTDDDEFSEIEAVYSEGFVVLPGAEVEGVEIPVWTISDDDDDQFEDDNVSLGSTDTPSSPSESVGAETADSSWSTVATTGCETDSSDSDSDDSLLIPISRDSQDGRTGPDSANTNRRSRASRRAIGTQTEASPESIKDEDSIEIAPSPAASEPRSGPVPIILDPEEGWVGEFRVAPSGALLIATESATNTDPVEEMDCSAESKGERSEGVTDSSKSEKVDESQLKSTDNVESNRTNKLGSKSEDGGSVETCNPMVSDEEELEASDEVLRGDRIGNTTYSQRHVLKILIKWLSILRNDPRTDSDPDSGLGDSEDSDCHKNGDFALEEEMALLWDMTYEPDVISFLITEGNAFSLIQQTLDLAILVGIENNKGPSEGESPNPKDKDDKDPSSSAEKKGPPARLVECALGILANMLSQPNVIEDFSVIDAKLNLVQEIMTLTTALPGVSILVQAFAVLRRVTWALSHVGVHLLWTKTLLSPEFVQAAVFILSSSRNSLLLGHVILCLCSLLEAISSELEKEEKEDDESSNYFGTALQNKKPFPAHAPFSAKEAPFIPALTEGLKELLREPKALRRSRSMPLESEGRPAGTEERACAELEEDVPEGHIQSGLLGGISLLALLHKSHNGKEAIRESHQQVTSFLYAMLRKSELLLKNNHHDYYVLVITLLSFTAKECDSLSPETVELPLQALSNFVKKDEDELTLEDKDGLKDLSLVIHEYLATLGDHYGQADVRSIAQEKFPSLLKEIHSIVEEETKKNQTEIEEESRDKGTD